MKCPNCNHKINPAQLLGSQSGKNMTAKQRSERAKKAVKARWNKNK